MAGKAAVIASLGLLICASSCAGAVSPAPPGAVPVNVPAGVAARGYVDHVVVIVQENRTFDDIFGGYPGGPTPFAGADSTISGPIVNDLRQAGFDTAVPDNGQDPFRCLQVHNFNAPTWEALVNGAWPTAPPGGPAPCPTSAPASNPDTPFRPDRDALTIIRQSDRLGYWGIAQAYELGDEFFAVQSSNSFPGHQYIVALSSQNDLAQQIDDVPSPSPSPGATNAPPPNCGSTVPPNSVATPVLDLVTGFTDWQLEGETGICWGGVTFADRLNARGVTWRHYSTDSTTGVFDGFINFRAWYPLTKIVPGSPFRIARTDLETDIRGNDLPQFTWVKPPCIYFSDHPGTSQSPVGGQDWVSSVIDWIGENPTLWPHTVIFVVWDDWGGFYDHVTPPNAMPGTITPGMREPFLVISPYNRANGTVIHSTATYASVLKFVEDLYGVQPLNQLDANAPDLAPYFDFRPSNVAFRPVLPINPSFNAPRDCAVNPGIPANQVDR